MSNYQIRDHLIRLERSVFNAVMALTLITLVSPEMVFAAPAFCDKQKPRNVIFCQDFQDSKPGLYDSEAFDEDWADIKSLSNKLGIRHLGIKQKRVSIAQTNDNKVLDVLFPKGKFGPKETGASWIVKFPGVYEQLSLEYKVMFNKGFLFSRDKLIGGKLPGLMGGKSISGNANANGSNGWTSRIMWGQQGRGLGYVYYPDMRDHDNNKQACPRTGQRTEDCKIYRNKYFTYSVNSNSQCISEWPEAKDEFKFESKRFYTIKQHIKMNTANPPQEGNRDGVIKIWVDDRLLLNCTNIRFRDVPGLGIDSLLFNTFFGGNTAQSSAHPTDENIYFDDILVSFE